MYEKDGEKYFVLDTHTHFWDASPENWVKGAEQYAKGWIECFHAYQGLGPPETHWSIEHFQKYSEEDFEKDVYTDGYVDVAITQPTYLREWYTEGFNDLERNSRLLERFPGKFIVNGRLDPREGEAGLEQLEADHERFGIQGVKLYTAEWREGSRGWTLADPECEPFYAKCEELGIKNIHVHKGPTIWPLDKDSFDVKDVDIAATSHQDLNFIVEHVGLPRIEDFCFMATQEPNVYAGLSVVVGGFLHARPRFFAKVMGELLVLGRRGQDDVRLGLRDLGAGVADRGARRLGLSRRHVLGLPALDDGREEEGPRPERRPPVRRRRARGVPARRGGRHARRRGRRAARRGRGVITQARVLAALATVHDPELDEPITSLGFVGSCVVSDGGDVDVHLRLPTPQCAPNFAFLMAADAREAVRSVAGVREVGVVLDDHYTASEINAAVSRGEGFDGAFPGESAGDLDALRELFRRKALLARQGRVAAMLLPPGGRVHRGAPTDRGGSAAAGAPPAGGTPADHAALVALCVADLPPDHPEVARCLALRRELGLPCGPDAPALVAGDGSRMTAEELPLWLRRARLVGLSLESNGGLCRSLLRIRHGVPDQTEEVAT